MASSTGPFKNCEFDPDVVEAFRPAFEACEALLRFAVENRPSGPLTDDAAGRLIFRTYARSSKTYNASFLLSGRGYGVQAGMLNRALYEDMVVAHWIKLNPVDAPEKYERNRRHLIEQMRGALAKHGAGVEMEALPELTDGDRKAYAQEFGKTSGRRQHMFRARFLEPSTATSRRCPSCWTRSRRSSSKPSPMSIFPPAFLAIRTERGDGDQT